MATPLIAILQEVLEVDAVYSVVVTPIVDDGTGTGTWVRSIQVFAAPYTVAPAPPVLQINIKSTTEANLEITTPQLNF